MSRHARFTVKVRGCIGTFGIACATEEGARTISACASCQRLAAFGAREFLKDFSLWGRCARFTVKIWSCIGAIWVACAAEEGTSAISACAPSQGLAAFGTVEFTGNFGFDNLLAACAMIITEERLTGIVLTDPEVFLAFFALDAHKSAGAERTVGIFELGKLGEILGENLLKHGGKTLGIVVDGLFRGELAALNIREHIFKFSCGDNVLHGMGTEINDVFTLLCGKQGFAFALHISSIFENFEDAGSCGFRT